MIKSIHFTALAIVLTQLGQTVASLPNQEDLHVRDDAAKELRFALNHQTGIFVDLVSNLTKGFLDHQEAVATSTSSQLVELQLSYGILSHEFKELRKELKNLKADFIETKTGSDTIKEELRACQSELQSVNNKISFLTEKIEHEGQTTNDGISFISERFDSKISILSDKVDQEISNLESKAERDLKSTNDKMSLLMDKVEHKISVAATKVETKANKEISLLANKLNHEMQASNTSVLALADKFEQESEKNMNAVSDLANKIECEVASVNKNITVLFTGMQAKNKGLIERIEYEEQINSNKLVALEAKFMDNLSSANTSILHLEDKLGNEMENANQKIFTITKKVENNQIKNSIYFDASRKTSFTSNGNLTYEAMTSSNNSGMDPSSGIFKAKIAGIYVFTFHTLSINNKGAYTTLYHNGVVLGTAYEDDLTNHNMIGQSVIVQLAKDDLVWVTVRRWGVFSDGNTYIHFTGFLLNLLE